jgi:hypothetical protein
LYTFILSCQFPVFNKNHINMVTQDIYHSDMYHVLFSAYVIFLYYLYKNVQYIHQKDYFLLITCYNYK